jgi:hypothetical protein
MGILCELSTILTILQNPAIPGNTQILMIEKRGELEGLFT